MVGAVRKERPCSICRRWFLPDARAGDRQRACEREECQRERHRRADRRWRAANRDYDRDREYAAPDLRIAQFRSGRRRYIAHRATPNVQHEDFTDYTLEQGGLASLRPSCAVSRCATSCFD